KKSVRTSRQSVSNFPLKVWYGGRMRKHNQHHLDPAVTGGGWSTAQLRHEPHRFTLQLPTRPERVFLHPGCEGEPMSNSITPLPEGHEAALRSRVRTRPLILALVLAGLLDACGGGGSGQSAGQTTSSAAGAPGPPTQAGHYVGAVRIADATYFGDAVVTQADAMRLYIGGPYDNGGVMPLVRRGGERQLLGGRLMREGEWGRKWRVSYQDNDV